MGETALLIWLGAVLAVGINGFAGGVAAMLFIWRRRIRKGGRIALSAVAAGVLPATLIAVIGISEEGFSGEGPLIVALASGLFLAIGSVIALPGAILVARGLERPGDAFKTFE